MAKITDENDTLVDVPDDDLEDYDPEGMLEDMPGVETVHSDDGDIWTETPGGFVSSTILIDDDIITDLVDLWARDNLRPESLEQYNEMVQTTTQREALYAAVVNDQLVSALKAALDNAESNDAE